MVTIADLGILRAVDVGAEGVVVTITPTYSGCPAMREIGVDVRHRLVKAGFDRVTVKTQLAPPWTTDWITADGRRKLAEAGIAPPSPAPRRSGPVPVKLSTVPTDLPRCPRCGSAATSGDGAVQRHRVQVAAPLRGVRRAVRGGEGPMTAVATASRTTFYPLVVVDVEALTDDSAAITFAVPAELAEAFAFAPGQSLTCGAVTSGARTPSAPPPERRRASASARSRAAPCPAGWSARSSRETSSRRRCRAARSRPTCPSPLPTC